VGLRGPSRGVVPDAGEEIEPLRTDLPGQVEHIIAYSGSAAIAMAGYGLNRSPVPIIGWFWLYAGVLEYLQNFSPGRNPPMVDFAASPWSPVRRIYTLVGINQG
jgi:VanZ family protein